MPGVPPRPPACDLAHLNRFVDFSQHAHDGHSPSANISRPEVAAAVAYEHGTVTVQAAGGQPAGTIEVAYELIAFTECPTCRFDSLAQVVIHGPAGDTLWSNCDRCTDDPSHDEGAEPGRS
jgi:hypothetical protein